MIKQRSREEVIAATRAFRHTWHMAQEGGYVWTTYRGDWVAGSVASFSKKAMTITIETKSGKIKSLSRPFDEVRARRPELEGDDIPLDQSPRQEAAEERGPR